MPAVLVRADLSKDVELLVLRHENQVLRRQLGGRPRWGHVDRLRLAALSMLVRRRRRAEVFPVTPATLLRWHRNPVARKWTFTGRRRSERPCTRQSVKALIIRMAREVVETVLLKRLYVLVFTEYGTRRLHLAGVTPPDRRVDGAAGPQPGHGPG
ncbi:hypothetical protein AB0J35_59235 [Nonomuraea angiospora]|uniref:hypothetical protein n=1 Tax=Nonomuraea angiospora TaxID=46172 RepID=UPI00344AA400